MITKPSPPFSGGKPFVITTKDTRVAEACPSRVFSFVVMMTSQANKNART